MIKKIVFLCLFSLSLIADSIGYAAAETPDFGSSVYVNDDTLELFDEIVELAYDVCGDAGITVIVKLRLTADVINFKDTKVTYKGRDYILKPHEINAGAIEYFYNTYNQEGRQFLNKVARKNKLDALFYAKFKKSSLKKAIKRKEKQSTLIFIAQLYLPQSGATQLERVKIEVEDLATEPMYDLDVMKASITKSYLKMYEKALKLVQMTGGTSTSSATLPEEEEQPEVEYTTDEDTGVSIPTSKASQAPVYDENW